MQNLEDISNPTITLDMALELMAKAFQLNNTTPTNNKQRSSSNLCYSQIAQSGHLVRHNVVQNQGIQNDGNQNGLSVVLGIENQHGNGIVVAARAEVKQKKRDAAYLQTQLQIAQKEESRIQLNFEEFNFVATAGAYDEIEEVNANYTLKENLQQASTSSTQTDNALVYDSDGSVEVSEQKDTTKCTSVNTQFRKQSILGKPPSSSGPKLYSVTPLPKSKVFPKVGESNVLSKPVTSNSAPSSRKSTVVNNERVIAPGIFRINPFKASRVDKFMPNKHVKASVMTKPITVSQPHVITKKDVNSIINGFSPKMLKALLGPEDHRLGTILGVIRSLLSLRVVTSRIS
nr:hypothetical protein [Tanacetum cinerariifolium]